MRLDFFRVEGEEKKSQPSGSLQCFLRRFMSQAGQDLRVSR